MILKGNQRGGGQQLAAHLMNSFDNERVEIADVRGAVARDLSGAFAEWKAQASATKCQKNLYSLSLNPDQTQGHLTREQYLELLERTERSLKLVGQPRAVVFHEKRDKDGVPREHCHAVWSRIDTEKMKAVQIAHDRLKLRTVAREFARDHGLELPDGMKKDGRKSRFNERAQQETIAEWQQRERTGIGKLEIMADITRCWKETTNGTAFAQALEAKGYLLARGDSRAYVVVDLSGGVHSLARQIEGVKTRELKQRLADYPVEKLADVESAKAWAKQRRDEYEKQKQGKEPSDVEKRRAALQERQQQRRQGIDQKRNDTLARHVNERGALKEMQNAENTGVVGARLAAQPRGIRAFLTLITGIKMITAVVQRREDTKRAARHKEQDAALRRRHEREIKAMDRHTVALDRLEARENRSVVTAFKREQFQKTVALMKKPPARALTPEFNAAVVGWIGVGKDDDERKGKLKQEFTAAAAGRGSETKDQETTKASKLAASFNRAQAASGAQKGDLQRAFERATGAKQTADQTEGSGAAPDRLAQAEKTKAELEQREREQKRQGRDRETDRDPGDRGI